MTSIIAALLIFDAIILFHEGGHFLLARRAGICVIEFSVGFGPRLITFVHGGTRYSLKLLPLGGSCIMLGDDFDEEDLKALRAPKDRKGKSFDKATVFQRFFTVVAGPVFNFILAFLGSVFLVCTAGYDPAVLSAVSENSAAKEAGLTAGDEIYSVNGHRTYLFREMRVVLTLHAGEPVEIVYKRDGETGKCVVTPEFSEEKNAYVYGLVGGAFRKSVHPLEVAKYAYAESRYWAYVTLQSLERLLTQKVSPDNIGGPVRIVGMLGSTVEQSAPYGALTVAVNVVTMMVLLSVNLGFMNLLPIPALDGGKLILLVIEMIRRKRLSKALETRINLIGASFLIALMLFAVFNDIRVLFKP